MGHLETIGQGGCPQSKKEENTTKTHTHMHTNTRFLSKMSQDIQILPHEHI